VSYAALLKHRLDRFERVLPDVETGDVRALHRARVATRRLRELVPILRLESSSAKKLNRRLRKITARLGKVRELDVSLLLIDELHAEWPSHRDALDHVHAALSSSRDEARATLIEHLPMSEMRRVARKLSRALAGIKEADRTARREKPHRRKSSTWALDARIAHRAARLAEALRDAGAVYLPERLHDARIAVKKLRYALELSSPKTNRSGRSDLRALERLQEILGRMHDFQILIDRVRDVQASLALPTLTMSHRLDTLVVALDEMCRRLHARFVRERVSASAITSRLSRADSALRDIEHGEHGERKAV